jgi:hypothetical protein
MLLDPLTPPQDHSTPPGSDTYNGNGVTSPMGSNSHSFAGHSANTFAPTPVSNMGLDSRDERGELGEQAGSYDSTDEDQDMSDGGAALTMTLSHAEALNAELDLLDAEVMGPDNFTGLHLDTHFPAMVNHDNDDVFLYADLPDSEPHSPHPQYAQEDIIGNDPMDTPSLPTTMSQVSQHLQHIQDGQEHVELDMATDEHGAFTNNSTHPFLLPYVPHFQAMHGSAGTQQAADYVSLSDLSSVQSTPVNPSHSSAVGSGVGLAPQIAATNSLVQPQNPLNASHLSFVDMSWEEESDADPHEVEDQSNLSLGDFLYNWGVSASRSDDSRRRNRGPILPVLDRQRFVENLEPMRRCDLQGDLCDIQRINWTELGVSRPEARQMRRQTYVNYTNVRLAYQWHVSIVSRVDIDKC